MVAYLSFSMSAPRFIPRAERERLAAAAEAAKAEQQRKAEEHNQVEIEVMLLRAKQMEDASEESTSVVPPAVTAPPVKNRFQRRTGAKFKFDWDQSEDTSAPIDDELYASHVGGKGEEVVAAAVQWRQKLTSEMTSHDWLVFREDHHIAVTGARGKPVPFPFRAWSESGLPFELLEAIHKAGYAKPTPIQMQAIPIALAGRDLVGISSTGSGKTAAFVLPMLTHIKKFYETRFPSTAPPSSYRMSLGSDGPLSLVLAPSRELAIQIETEASKFSSFCKIKTCSIVGGRSAEHQTMILSQGVELIVATPGRLADSLDAKQTVLNQCFYLVLDEADKMVDLGFEAYVNRILDSISTLPEQDRITQMFSATMPVSVEKLTRKYLRNPVTVTVGDLGSAKSDIQQRLEFVTEKEKRRTLLQVIGETEMPAIVFVNSKRQADFVGQTLDSVGHRVIVLHSGKMQDKREEAIGSFRAGKADVLVATDVAGRGIDIPGVQHVINYDMARNIEDYTHRIGRTGRAGKAGIATTFLTKEDEPVLSDLKKFMIQSKQFIPEELQRVESLAKKRGDSTIYII